MESISLKGYASNQIGGGYIAYRFGFKLAIGVGISVGAVLTVLFPYIVTIPTHGFYLAVAARVLTGIFHVGMFIRITTNS